MKKEKGALHTSIPGVLSRFLIHHPVPLLIEVRPAGEVIGILCREDDIVLQRTGPKNHDIGQDQEASLLQCGPFIILDPHFNPPLLHDIAGVNSRIAIVALVVT